jgi:hypothetical protein
MCDISLRGIYLAMKKNEILIHATTWMKLKNMLSERTWSQNVTCCIVPFI